MRRIGVGVDESDRDRLDARRDQRIDSFGGGGQVERLGDIALRIDSLGHGQSKAAWDERLRLLPGEIVEARHAERANLQNVPEPRRADQADPRAATLQDRVGGDGRAMSNFRDVRGR